MKFYIEPSGAEGQKIIQGGSDKMTNMPATPLDSRFEAHYNTQLLRFTLFPSGCQWCRIQWSIKSSRADDFILM